MMLPKSLFRGCVAICLLAIFAMAAPSSQGTLETYVPLYKTLPPTPELPPSANFQGTVAINGINLWYAHFGPSLQCGRLPVLFLHGGKSCSRWWGEQIDYVSRLGHPVIAIDTRAHGRSSDDIRVPLSYDLFADDVSALMIHLELPRAGLVGWSDGANTALSMAMRYSKQVDRLLAFGANYNPDQVNATGVEGIPFLSDLAARMKRDYISLSPTPGNFATFSARVDTMQSQYPTWSSKDFARIPTSYQDASHAPITWMVDGDSEEVVVRRVPGEIRDMVWGSSLVTLPDVSHFAPVQDPETFNAVIGRWLSRRSNSRRS
ncbi:hypothetical protein NLU13_2139 [Sarocladium strictum]|uniref:AB hydrolase-1 domain-containing protein n=1 Tax=Sarocladium strictum TaxID=5046 RepID=A0AA39LD62_SARSR|nr:hypothetical protein NLU13_2139 [Sarocladium strictum]